MCRRARGRASRTWRQPNDVGRASLSHHDRDGGGDGVRRAGRVRGHLRCSRRARRTTGRRTVPVTGRATRRPIWGTSSIPDWMDACPRRPCSSWSSPSSESSWWPSSSAWWSRAGASRSDCRTPDTDVLVAPPVEADEPPVELSAPPATIEKPEATASRMQRLRQRLAGSQGALGRGLLALLSREKLDEDTWESIEDALLTADVGVGPTQELVERLRTRLRVEGGDAPDPRTVLREELVALVDPTMDRRLQVSGTDGNPGVVLVVGVNGAGKTTTVGKIAADPGRRGQDRRAGCRGHVPRRGRRPAGHLGRAGRRRGGPRARGHRPGQRRLRGGQGGRRPGRRHRRRRHRRTARRTRPA